MADSFRSWQVNPPAKEILQEKGEVHEVPERRVFELHKYVDVAIFRLFSSDKRAEEAYAAHSEPVLDLLLVASEDLDDFQKSPLIKYANAPNSWDSIGGSFCILILNDFQLSETDKGIEILDFCLFKTHLDDL